MKLMISLIHNNDEARLRQIIPFLNQLKANLPSGFQAELIEISKQPEIIAYPLWLTLLTKCFYWQINRQWQSYKLIKPRNIILDLVILLRRLILTSLHQNYENRRLAVYAILTNKHLEVWNYFFNSDADFLISFEDDAVFKRDSITTFKKFLKEVKLKDKPVYLDLGGGNPPEVNKVDTLEIKSDELHKYYKKPVTNTACCYLINKKTAAIFIDSLIRRPWLRLLGVDWLMNELFILSVPKHKYFCFHASPSIFKHGSIDGTFQTSI